MPNTLHLKFSRPGRASIAGEDIFVAVYNPDGLDLDIVFISSTVDQTGAKKVVRHSTQWTGNPTVIKTRTFPDGPFQIVARTKGDGPQIRSNSITGQIYPDTEPNRLWVAQDRVAEHRMDSAIRTSSKSVLTLTNPWVRPGRSLPMEGTKWFPTAVYEGATSLYNETRAYYEDPLAYFVAQILRLKKKGLTFVTWHDVLDDPERDYSSAVLLQFDLDAGPRSFRRIADILIKAGIRATGMIHWRARHWYDYDFESDDIAALQEIEKAGWAFGYHHNCLTTLVGPSEDRLNTPDIKQQAQAMMRDEIAQLRQHLNIRTLTHHGGNVVNASVEIPQDIDIVPVDRPINPEPWAQVRTCETEPGALST